MARKSWRGKEWRLGRHLTFDDLAAYGIDENSAFSVLRSAEVALECVKRVPELHIISLIDNEKPHFYNRYIPQADAYFLSDGDPNPDIVEVVEPLCLADIDEMEEDFREMSGGQLSAFDQLLVRFLRMIVTDNVSLKVLTEPQHRRVVMEWTIEENRWRQCKEQGVAAPLSPGRKR